MKNFNPLLLIFLCLSTLTSFAQTPCANGVDIHIANDISGSVDSREFQQSKDFVSLLGANFGNAYGIANNETRVSISNWSAGSGRFVEYAFPSAGQNYATTISDILSYTFSARPFRGGTDISTALLRAGQWVKQNPEPNRTVPKVIVLLTDSSCFQVAANTSSIATQLKNQGIFIVVLAIDAAKDCSNIADTNIASLGGYFNADDYATLQNDAIDYINNLRNATCTNIDPEPYDLTVNLSNYTIGNCDTAPSASVNYTVTNTSKGDAFNGNLQVSFYNGNPTQSGTQFLFKVDAGSPNIGSGITFDGGSVTDPSLVNNANLFAIANFDGSNPANAVPISLSNLPNQILVAEKAPRVEEKVITKAGLLSSVRKATAISKKQPPVFSLRPNPLRSGGAFYYPHYLATALTSTSQKHTKQTSVKKPAIRSLGQWYATYNFAKGISVAYSYKTAHPKIPVHSNYYSLPPPFS
jgi:hypothetical protein